jgi:hypothetical protein
MGEQEFHESTCLQYSSRQHKKNMGKTSLLTINLSSSEMSCDFMEIFIKGVVTCVMKVNLL